MSRITPWLIGATIIAILAVSVLSLRRRFYPPEANGREIYAEQRGVPSGCVSHETFDELLKKHVKGDLIDYSALKGDSAALKMYLDSLADVVVKNCSRDELLALYINAYNAATLHLILEHYPGIASIKDIPADTRWNAKRWKIAGETLSLSDVEHQVLRNRFAEPRIHFAINCASLSCPPLRSEAYTAARLEKQLQAQAEHMHRGFGGAHWNAATRTLNLSRIYDWYEGDFTRKGETLATYAAKFMEPDAAKQVRTTDPKIKFQEYDWSLNNVKQE